MYTLITKYVLAPLLYYSRGTRVNSCSRELEESQWWPRDKILELQDQRLRQLVRYAYDKVPYYRRIFDERDLKPEDIKCSADLVKLPILTKKIIRRNFNQMMADGFPSKEMIITRTGGSTGEPLELYHTRDEQQIWAVASQERTKKWRGYELGDKRLIIRMMPLRQSMTQSIKQFLERTMAVKAWEMSQELTLFARKFEGFQPQFIVGYPSSIYLLAQFIQRQGRPRLRPKAVCTYSEPLYDFQKELYRKIFDCEVYSYYASFEMNLIGAECPHHSGYHITAENLILEIVNDRGALLPAGSEGRILITNLHNYAMPFVRYDIGDVGVLSDEGCSCGRGLPLLVKLVGRMTDFIVKRDNTRIPGVSLPWEFLASEGIEQFQIVQERYQEIKLKLVPVKETCPEDKDRLTAKVKERWQDTLGEDIQLTVEFVKEIPTTGEGKRRVVVSKLPIDETHSRD